MEKKENKKTSKSIKEEKKVSSKKSETKVVKKDESNENAILSKENKLLIKVICIVASFFATMFSLVVCVFGFITTFAIAGGSKEQLIGDNTVITFLSRMNNYTVAEAESAITGMGNKFLFILFEVLVPAIALICAMLLVIYLSTRVLNFIHNIETEDDLFTKKKYQEVKDMVSILSTILFVTFLIFNTPSFIFYMLIELFGLTVIFLYKKVLDLKKK